MYKLPFLSLICLLLFAEVALLGSCRSSKPRNTIKNMTIGKDYAADWQQIAKLEAEGRTQDARKIAQSIYEKAKGEQNYAQIVKSLLHIYKYDTYTEEDSTSKIVEHLRNEIATADATLKPILQSILAEIYTQYFESTRYQILQRTDVAGDTSGDIATWSAPRFMREARDLYLASVQNAETLRLIPLQIYDPILTKQDKSQIYRPTLYDFLAHRAIAFFSNDMSGIAQTADQFLIKDPVVFADAKKFANAKFTTNDSTSLRFFALRLYQDLTQFHLNDAEATPLAQLELNRLQFAHQYALIPEKGKLYLEALDKVATTYAAPDPQSMAVYYQAQYYNEQASQYNTDDTATAKYQFDRQKAWEICQKNIEKYPNSMGATNCQVLKVQIENPSLQVTAEQTTAPDKPFRLLAAYANTPTIYGKTVHLTPEVKKKLEYLQQRGDEWLDFINSQKPATTFTQALPNLKDYQTHKIEIKADPLPLGEYMVLVANNPTYTFDNKQVVYTTIKVTNLAYIKQDTPSLVFHVFHRQTSQPLADVKVELFARYYDYQKNEYSKKMFAEGKTDAQGRFNPAEKRSQNGYGLTVKLTQGDDVYENDYYENQYHEPSPPTRTEIFLFTDRSIYRPAQTLYFKGIAVDTDGKTSDLKKDHKVSVQLYDPNGQMVTSQDMRTNEFGSIAGQFTLPDNLLNGQFRLQANKSNTYISVEEYKRPKFEVTFPPVEGSYRLKDNVTVKGKALNYAGSAVDGAKVTYRVVRQARFPYWWCWWRPFPTSPDAEIAQGTTTTDMQGEFNVNFVAIPDETISPNDNPQFSYTIYADVTDLNGETRSQSTNVQVGYNALLIDLNLPEQLEKNGKNTFDLTSTNLNGQFERTNVTVAIYALKQPQRLLRARLWEKADQTLYTEAQYRDIFPLDVYQDEDKKEFWQRGEKVFNKQVTTDKAEQLSIAELAKLPNGVYVAELTAQDKFGQSVKKLRYFTLYDLKARQIPTNELFWTQTNATSIEVGEDFTLAFGTEATDMQFWVVVFAPNQKIVHNQWYNLSREMKTITLKVEEAYRGGFAAVVYASKYNRQFNARYHVAVPWSNKELVVETAVFRDKILPASEEEWTIKIQGKKAEKVAAELLTTMYDASLDAFKPHNWTFGLYPTYYYRDIAQFDNGYSVANSNLLYNSDYAGYISEQHYDALNWFSFYMGRGHFFIDGLGVRGMASTKAGNANKRQKDGGVMMYAPPPMPVMAADAVAGKAEMQAVVQEETSNSRDDKSTDKRNTDGDTPQIRRNLQETAFFFPQLKTNDKGEVIFSFKAPEALTRWKMMAFAHTKDLKYGSLVKEVVTQKELMVMPNAPRFMREGDQMEFAAKINNLSSQTLNGSATLELFDALTMQPLNDKFANTKNSRSFTTNSQQSAAVSWQISIPEGVSAVLWRVVAKAGNFSDGEENAMPVLTNRMLVTESLPLPMRSKQTRTFNFANLVDKSKASNTLRHERLTLEYTSNPAWYAVQALPYLMEFPHDCTEQIFSRYYANSLASHVANSSPTVKKVFDLWTAEAEAAAVSGAKGSGALLSNLEKNQELKSLLLQETPWVMEAKDESERKKRLGVLLDLDRMRKEQKTTEQELIQRQTLNGGWSWFPGMPESAWITQHLVAGMGHLNKLGVRSIKDDAEMQNVLARAVEFVDREMQKSYEYLKKNAKNLKEDHIYDMPIHYLYARSFFVEQPITSGCESGFNYFKQQAEQYALSKSRYMQGMIALALHRFDKGDSKMAHTIMEAMRQNAVYSDELGMYYKDNVGGWYWYQAPIETQALLIEAFDEVANDAKSVDELKLWLLKQKQTQDWKTTKATAEACYALLLTGDNWLASQELVEITIGNKTLNPLTMPNIKTEAGTGYFKTAWDGQSITTDMAKITVINKNNSPAWGAAYWQYFEQLDKITPAETPLSIKKQLFVERNTKTGLQLDPLAEGNHLKIGDKVKVRIEIRVDRDMEYVHLKDMRAAGFEPINVISHYKWQDGLGYYESTKDAATHFFMDRLPKGTYVFEYPLRANARGDFSNGITSIQCMYAPEFSSHSEGIRLKID